MKHMRICGFLVALIILSVIPAQAYLLTTTVYDADKTRDNTDDDYMCWAAAASNMLAWGGWNANTSYSTTEAIFSYYQDHWSDAGSLTSIGLGWWFDGADSTPITSRYDSWANVEVAGGGFWNSDLFNANFHESTQRSSAWSTIVNYLNQEWATSLGIYTSSGGGHAITVWGYDADTMSLWITDSDDEQNGLVGGLFEISLSFNKDSQVWTLSDYWGGSGYYIGTVYGLDAATPIPGAVWLLGSGLIGMIGFRRKMQQ